MNDRNDTSLTRVNELFQQAASLIQHGDLTGALKVCDQAIRLCPQLADSHNNRGVVLKELGRMQEALTAYERAIQINPGLAGAHYNRALILMNLGRQAEALESYEYAIHVNPQYADAHCNRGHVLKRMGRFSEASKAFRTALQHNPGLVEAGYMLATLGDEETPQKSPQEYIANVFDNCADQFDNILGDKLKYQIPQLLFDAVNQQTDTKKRKLDILDLGCGTGLCGAVFSGCAKYLMGVDLSVRMIEKARERGVYTHLVQDDIEQALEQCRSKFDLILSADVFIYIGKLEDVFSLIAGRLNPGGIFAFSIEVNETGIDYQLRLTGRYAQSQGYIQHLAKINGLEELSSSPVVIRYEQGNPVTGNLIVLRLPV